MKWTRQNWWNECSKKLTNQNFGRARTYRPNNRLGDYSPNLKSRSKPYRTVQNFVTLLFYLVLVYFAIETCCPAALSPYKQIRACGHRILLFKHAIWLFCVSEWMNSWVIWEMHQSMVSFTFSSYFLHSPQGLHPQSWLTETPEKILKFLFFSPSETQKKTVLVLAWHSYTDHHIPLFFNGQLPFQIF